jgi:hypothetical protein
MVAIGFATSNYSVCHIVVCTHKLSAEGRSPAKYDAAF